MLGQLELEALLARERRVEAEVSVQDRLVALAVVAALVLLAALLA